VVCTEGNVPPLFSLFPSFFFPHDFFLHLLSSFGCTLVEMWCTKGGRTPPFIIAFPSFFPHDFFLHLLSSFGCALVYYERRNVVSTKGGRTPPPLYFFFSSCPTPFIFVYSLRSSFRTKKINK